MRLVDTDAIKLSKGFFENVNNVPKFYEWLNTLPTVDTVKHGKWIFENRTWFHQPLLKCSCCGKRQFVARFDYCPNCGARMDKRDDDE